MNTFKLIQFRGTFRDYQQTVLDNMQQHLENKKIHIVAAPGSGKTVLGLELIRRLNCPALILSPTVTIRGQWGMRFKERFLPETQTLEDYFSFELKNPNLMTSVTYQALYAAMNHINEAEDRQQDTDDAYEPESKVEDFSGFNLIETIRKAGIKTICLDEAHHLRSEWQKALEQFIYAIQSEVTVIALTATPPYESTPSEWNRYISLCGEIDDEIFVPQLVTKGTLCPHQDYIYFNYPTKAELNIICEYKEKAASCTSQIINGELLDEIIRRSGLLTDYAQQKELILENTKGFIALLCLVHAKGQKLPRKLIKLLCPGGRLPLFKLQFAETAFEFVINHPDIFSEETALNLKRVLSQHGLMQRRKVRLVSNDRIKRSLISSMGKLNSIVNIVDTEANVLGQSLRMLILTDYIKKDLLRIVGKDAPIDTMGAVPIFEAVRRRTQSGLNIAVLSGTLVIVPNTIIGDVKNIAASKHIEIKVKPVGDMDYSELLFRSSNKSKVAVITEAFQQGLIHVLIGTKSLLGEGWDSPCINSLILASFVGSFVLSNQMRGRAIRSYAGNPKKVSNIWHLVTVEPMFLSIADLLKNLYNPDLYNKERIASEDYNMLVRRFECFIAPSYDGSMIENGIGRINIIKPPYDKKGIERINQQMRTRSADRAALAQQWWDALSSIGHTEIAHVNELPKKVLPTKFVFINWFNVMLLNLAFILLVRNLVLTVFSADNFTILLAQVVLVAVISYLLFIGYSKLIRYISPKRTIKTLGTCVLKSLKEIGEIESLHAKLHIHANKSNTLINCMLRNATTHEKNVFARAMSELLTSIDNPRYVLIKRRRFLVFSWKDYSHSYACPAPLAVKKETVNILGKHLRQTTGKFELIYTRSEAGRKALLKCRKHSYININEIYIKGKRIAKSKWE